MDWDKMIWVRIDRFETKWTGKNVGTKRSGTNRAGQNEVLPPLPIYFPANLRILSGRMKQSLMRTY